MAMDHSKMDHGATNPDAATAKPVASVGDIAIAAPFARATPVKVGGAFMLLKNSGKADDKLVKAASPVAGHVEIHEPVMAGNAMRKDREGGRVGKRSGVKVGSRRWAEK